MTDIPRKIYGNKEFPDQRRTTCWTTRPDQRPFPGHPGCGSWTPSASSPERGYWQVLNVAPPIAPGPALEDSHGGCAAAAVCPCRMNKRWIQLLFVLARARRRGLVAGPVRHRLHPDRPITDFAVADTSRVSRSSLPR